MKASLTALVAVALFALLLPALAGAAPARPACSRVESATPVLDGQYHSVKCPEGTLTVTAKGGQVAPAVGAASVRSTTSRRTRVTTHTLIAGGERYGIVQR